MNREDKLYIAKIAYRTISKLVGNLESYLGANLLCNWPGTITIDDITFSKEELEHRAHVDKILEDSKDLIEKTKENLKKYRNEIEKVENET